MTQPETVDVERALADFHRLFEHTRRETPGLPPPETKALRLRLLREEFEETVEAIENNDLIEIADGLADLVYVAVGACISYGIPFNRVFAEVHRTNIAKLARCPTSGCRHEVDRDVPPGGRVSSLTGCSRCGNTGWVHQRDEGGKTIKPAGWTPPDIAGVLGLTEPSCPDCWHPWFEHGADGCEHSSFLDGDCRCTEPERAAASGEST